MYSHIWYALISGPNGQEQQLLVQYMADTLVVSPSGDQPIEDMPKEVQTKRNWQKSTFSKNNKTVHLYVF